MREKEGKKKGSEGEEKWHQFPLLEISLFNHIVVKMSTHTASFRILHGKISQLSDSNHIWRDEAAMTARAEVLWGWGFTERYYSFRPNSSNLHLHLWAHLDFKFNLISGYIKQVMELMDKIYLLKL